jgi:DNA-binding CsgD family transcriptional regulator
MDKLPTDEDVSTNDMFFKRPKGMLLDEQQWLFLKKRYHMTPRELQVAILVCRGFNNDEIAKALRIRQGTVKTHLRNIYRRARVKSKILLLLKFVADVNKLYPPSTPPPIPITEIKPKSNLPFGTSREKR